MSYNRKALSKAKLDLDKYKKPNPYKKDILYTQEGQWKYPGQKTRIPSSDITMQGVPFPVFAQPNVGQPQMMYPGQEYSFPGASYVDEYPQMKKGGLVQMPKPSKKGLASKKYSRSLSATNKLFTENPLFKKPKSKKRKVFDPNAKYYQDGGPMYSNLPPTYLTALQKFTQPNVSSDYTIEIDPETGEEVPVYRTGYDALNDTITYNPYDEIENVNNPWWNEHEKFHHLQNLAGGLSTSGIVGQRPNPYVASDESIGAYYDRRNSDVNKTIDRMIAQDPNLQFIPREKLAEGAGPGFIGAEELQYADPTTVEGEARQYEGYIEDGNPSIFPKKQNGGTNKTKLTNKEEKQFQNFYKTLPENLQTDDDTYDIRGYWDASGRPEEFDYSQPTESDGYYHAFSINPNTGEYLKSPAHPTFQHAIDEDRKIGYRPITNVYGRNIATEVPSIADPEETNPFAYTAGPANYMDIELDEDEIDQYVKGGYVVEELPEMQPGGPFKPGTGYKMPALNKSEIAAVKKEVSKAKPVAAKSTTTVKKPSSSNQVNKAKEDAAYEKFLDQNLGKEGSNTYTYVDPITNKTEQREYSNAHLKDNGNISVDEATWNANRDRQNKEHLSELLTGAGEITGINSAIRTGERIVDDPLKFADDLTTGISQIPETFWEGVYTLGSKAFGEGNNYIDVDTDALGVVADFAGALPVIGTAGKVTKPIIQSAKLKQFFNRPPGPLMLGLGSGTKTPKTIPNFESEIDWVNWVKKHNKNYDAEDIQNVIKNSEEYNIIEQQTKANGTWMTNADGTPFQGTPEQFIQQQSTKFKQAYPEGTEITYRGGDKSDALKSDWSDKSKVVFTTKDEYGARAYNRTLDEPTISLTEAPPEGISQLYMPQTTNKIVIDGNIYPIGHKNRNYGLPYIDDKGREVIDPAYRTNYARLNAIDQVPANELEAQNLEAFKNWMLEKHPTMTERGWSGEPRILNDWVMTDHFADFLNSPAGKDISRVEFQKIMDGTLKPIDVEVHNLNKAQQLKSRWGNSGEFDLTNPNKFKALLPYIIPTGLGTGAAAYGISENNTEPQNKKGGNINNYAPGGELSPKDLDPATLEKYLSDLRGLENSIKKGYKNNKWYPHASVEGGRKTIAYGHKLQPGESFASGLTEQQARDLQLKDVLVHQAKAEKYVDDKYGKGTYDKLPQNSQMMLTDYAYNLGGLGKFPSFVEGVVKGDKNKMLQQYERRGLPERNKWTKDVINTTDFSKDSDYGFNWMFDLDAWWNKKNGGSIELKIKNDKDLKRLIDQGYIIEEL